MPGTARATEPSTEKLPLEEVKKLNKEYILDMLGIDLGPVRLKCALLSLKVLKAGVYGLGEASDELVE